MLSVIPLYTNPAYYPQCTMLYRWWKYRKVASLNDDGVEQTDNEYSYHRRTIPPIAHLTNGGSQTSPPPPTGGGAADSKDKFGMGFISLTSKEKEAEDELAAELEEMVSGEGKGVEGERKGSWGVGGG